jgi:hypothetical protein
MRSDEAKARLAEQTRLMREILWGNPQAVRSCFDRLKSGPQKHQEWLSALPGRMLTLAEEGRVASETLKEILQLVADGRVEQAIESLTALRCERSELQTGVSQVV